MVERRSRCQKKQLDARGAPREEAEIGASISNRCTQGKAQADSCCRVHGFAFSSSSPSAHFAGFCSVRKQVYYTLVYLKFLCRRHYFEKIDSWTFSVAHLVSGASEQPIAELKRPAFPVWKSLAAFSSLSLAFDVFLKDSNDLGDPFGILICAVIRRHNLLGFGSADMRAPIRDDTIAAAGRISAATVTDDRMIGNAFRQWERVHDFHKRVVRRKCVDAVWHSF